MADRKITVKFDGQDAGLKSAADNASRSIKQVGDDGEKHGGRFGNAWSKLRSGFTKDAKGLQDDLGGISGGLGKLTPALGALGPVGIAAGVGITAVGAVAIASVNQFTALAQEVLKFQRVAGTTADESSRWVEVLSDYGIEADKGATLVGKFAKVVGETPQKFDELGVAIAKNKDGTVDLNGTLVNAAGAFAGARDETEKAKIGATLFGKAWVDLVPVLQKGATGLASAFKDVNKSKILDQKDLANAEALRLAMDDLHDAVQGAGTTIGRSLVPALLTAAESARILTPYVQGAIESTAKLGEVAATSAEFLLHSFGLAKGASNDLADAIVVSTRSLGEHADASKSSAEVAQAEIEATKEAAAA